MCGIFGIVLPPGQRPEEALVKKATDRLIHRGPDDGGYFFKDNLALGNRRLAILDLSDKGHQPMAHQNLTITYNGELYNYVEIRKTLQLKGYIFNTGTDTEVVLAAYKAWGENCVLRFNGMWAFAIYDPDNQILFCSRDRFGIKPFYYVQNGETLVFASEIKAFFDLPFWEPKLNVKMANDYLVNGLQNHTDQTLFKNVQQLPAGHHLIFDLGKHHLQIEKYYDVKTIQTNHTISYKAAALEFREKLKDAITLHSRSDVKVGSALSGGLDSSSIVALQYEILDKHKTNLEVVTYASEVPKFDESPFVKSLLKKHPIRVHTTTSTFEETFSKIDEVICFHDEPLLSASLIAHYFVFKTAKENGIKVMLDGQGADELLAGYGTYYIPFLKEIGLAHPIKLFQEIVGLLSKHEIKPGKKLSFFKNPPDYHQYLNLPKRKAERPGSGFSNYSCYMIQKGILPYLLQFEDRNSMAHSVESRVPFLDYRLVEFCMSLPPDFKIRNGIRKMILREAMKNDLPDTILKRYDKMGFVTPQEHWMSQHPEVILASIQNSILENPSIFNPKLTSFAKQVLNKKQTEHYAFLWRIMTFGRWMQLLKLSQGANDI